MSCRTWATTAARDGKVNANDQLHDELTEGANRGQPLTEHAGQFSRCSETTTNDGLTSLLRVWTRP
ncbi:MAG: hypothetical protein ACR2RE_31745, partial [Geminicoccaceae bacterium]